MLKETACCGQRAAYICNGCCKQTMKIEHKLESNPLPSGVGCVGVKHQYFKRIHFSLLFCCQGGKPHWLLDMDSKLRVRDEI